MRLKNCSQWSRIIFDLCLISERFNGSERNEKAIGFYNGVFFSSAKTFGKTESLLKVFYRLESFGITAKKIIEVLVICIKITNVSLKHTKKKTF